MRNSQAYYLRQSHLAARRRRVVPLAVALSVPVVRPSVLLWGALGSALALWCGILAQSAIAVWGGL